MCVKVCGFWNVWRPTPQGRRSARPAPARLIAAPTHPITITKYGILPSRTWLSCSKHRVIRWGYGSDKPRWSRCSLLWSCMWGSFVRPSRLRSRAHVHTYASTDIPNTELWIRFTSPHPLSSFLSLYVSPTFGACGGGGLYSDVDWSDQSNEDSWGRSPLVLFNTPLFLRQYAPFKNTNRLQNQFTQKTIHALITIHKSQGPLSVNTQISLAKNPWKKIQHSKKKWRNISENTDIGNNNQVEHEQHNQTKTVTEKLQYNTPFVSLHLLLFHARMLFACKSLCVPCGSPSC